MEKHIQRSQMVEWLATERLAFDMRDFYPSITEKLPCKAMDFANSYQPISTQKHDNHPC